MVLSCAQPCTHVEHCTPPPPKSVCQLLCVLNPIHTWLLCRASRRQRWGQRWRMQLARPHVQRCFAARRRLLRCASFSPSSPLYMCHFHCHRRSHADSNSVCELHVVIDMPLSCCDDRLAGMGCDASACLRSGIHQRRNQTLELCVSEGFDVRVKIALFIPHDVHIPWRRAADPVGAAGVGQAA